VRDEEMLAGLELEPRAGTWPRSTNSRQFCSQSVRILIDFK